jgi:hypothetical protein
MIVTAYNGWDEVREGERKKARGSCVGCGGEKKNIRFQVQAREGRLLSRKEQQHRIGNGQHKGPVVCVCGGQRRGRRRVATCNFLSRPLASAHTHTRIKSFSPSSSAFSIRPSHFSLWAARSVPRPAATIRTRETRLCAPPAHSKRRISCAHARLLAC